GRQEVAGRVKGQAADEVAVGGPFQARVGERGGELRGRQVIHEQTIAAAAHGELPVRGDGGGQRRLVAAGQRLKTNLAVRGDAGRGALVDPELEQAQLRRGERPGPHLVAGRRHRRLLLVRRDLQQQALRTLAGDDGGA